ncbi:adhesion G-protein coupled receptor G6-like [Asterias amurensis]|uniref:adhesion G-protein coupled receptor G6-like n=1 Tax=Asterias amurensis TaxID=7602 RepID=UPI003AB6025E
MLVPGVVLLLLWFVCGLHGAIPDVCQDGTGDGGNGQPCDCWRTPDGNLTVDCSYRGWVSIHPFPIDTSVLNLTHNNITRIEYVDFDRLDHLQELILTGNELQCDDQLVDFKSWLLNLKSVTSSVIVTGAICDNSIYSGQEVTEAMFGLPDRNCYGCNDATSNDGCTSISQCYPRTTCQNKVIFQANGEVNINKTCELTKDCLSSAAATNGESCRQVDGSTSVCVYCCQGTLCNKELNTINANYTFPFRAPLPVATEPPSTETAPMTSPSPLGTTEQSTIPITNDIPITNSPDSTCFSEVTLGDTGVITWPATGVNQTVTVPCPYNTIGVGMSFACRTCFWNDSNGPSFWEDPDTDNCSSASNVLKELINIQITEENVLDVSSTLESVTSYPASLKADDVTNAVGVLSSLLRTLKLYPVKGREIFKDSMATAFQMTSVRFEELVNSQIINRTTSRLLYLINEFTIQVPLINSTQLTSESRAVDVIIVDARDQSEESILFGGSQSGEDDDVKPFILRNETSPGNGTDLLGYIHVPSRLLQDAGVYLSTCQFLLYQQTTYFNAITTSVESQTDGFKSTSDNVTGTVLNSAVISASVGNLTLTDLAKPVRIHLQVLRTQSADNPQCVFWDVNANDFQGGWSTEGCSLISELTNSETVVCECDHLTNFAMLMDIYNKGEPLDPVHAQILSVLSYIGCSISIVALALTILTLGCFREEPKYRADGSGSFNTGKNGKARADRHTNILVHLSVALALSNIAFLVNTLTVELGLEESVCIGMAAATHYSLLASMAWMALEAFNMYLALVLVFDKYYSRFMMKMCLFGWGTPFVIVAVTFGINFPENYGLYNGLCWLSRIPFYASFLAPVSVVLLFNLVIFLVVTLQLCKMRRRNISQSRRNFDLRAQFKACASITVLFGLTWFFALFGIGEANLAFSYLFVIFNTTQGFNIFVFQCLLKPSIRQRWMRLLGMQHGDISSSTKSSASCGKDSKNEGIVNAAELFKISEPNGIDNPICNDQS